VQFLWSVRQRRRDGEERRPEVGKAASKQRAKHDTMAARGKTHLAIFVGCNARGKLAEALPRDPRLTNYVSLACHKVLGKASAPVALSTVSSQYEVGSITPIEIANPVKTTDGIRVLERRVTSYSILGTAVLRATGAARLLSYSSRNATTGSTLVARSAGTNVATSAITARSSDTPTNVVGSVGVIE